MLYQNHYTHDEPSVIHQTFWRNLEHIDGHTRRFTVELAEGVLKHREALDLEIAAYLKGWTLDRLSLVDRFILEIAMLELMIIQSIPWKVVINEAVQLASYFSSDNSPKFVNGVLHAWCTANGKAKENQKLEDTLKTDESAIDWRDEDEEEASAE
jgi:transcription antitermination factor NusB